MRRFTLSVLLALFTIAGMAQATARIFAYDLNVTHEGDVYTFTFKANQTPTTASIVFFNASTGAPVGEVALSDVVAGANSKEVNLSQMPAAGLMTWGVKLHGANITSLQTVYQDNTTTYKRGFAVVNTNPESDFFGRIYGVCAKATPNFIQDYLVDYTLSTKTNYFSPSTQVGNPQRSCVAMNGDLYIADYGDAHSGVFVMNPSTHALNAIFEGEGLTTASSGLIKNASNQNVASSSPGCYVYGEGKDTKLYMVQEDFSGRPVTTYQLGQNDGSVLTKWTSAPTQTYTITGHDGGNSQIIVNDKGFWLCQYRGTNTESVPSLMFYSLNGTRTFSSGATAALRTAIPSNYRGAFAISQDGKKLVININSTTFSIFDVEWNGNTPSLTNKVDVTHSFGQMGQMAFDFAGNIIAIGGTYDSSMKLYVFATPTDNNECTVPAKKALTVYKEIANPVTGVTLDETSKTVTVGESFTLTATVAPNEASNKTISWSTSNSSVAIVADGVVTTKAVGTATITVTTEDGSFTATCDVTVDPKAPLAGTYNIGGASADYSTLYDAVSDMSTWGIGGDINFLICADLTEDHNIGLVNSSSYHITIRPDADADRTITFTNTDDNDGPSGAFIIGAPFGIADMSAVNTANITIDGLASTEATHKMKLQVSSTFGSNAGVIVFYGGITNTTLKNCKLVNNLVGSAYRAHCVAVRSTASAYPDGIIIENNEITSMTAGYGCPIYINGSASTSNPPANTIIRNNEIIGKRDAILFNYCNNLTIENNIFRIKGSNGVLGKAIGNYSGTAQSSGNIIIRKNQFVELLTNNGYDNNGFIAIEAVSGGNWTIENNLITGFDAVTNSCKGELIGIKTGSTPSSITIQHNTMFMPAFSKTITSSLLSGYPVSLIYIAAGSPVVKNNILANMETECVSSIIRGTLNANCTNNVYYLAGGNGVMVDGSKACADWTEFQTQYAAQAATSKNQQVELVDGYKIASAYVGNINLGMTPLDAVTADIEGNARHANITYAGCYEASDLNDAVVIEVTDVAITQTNMSVIAGYAQTLTATVNPDNATDKTLTWASDNAAVTIDPVTGAMTAVSVGTAHITATAGGITSDPITVEVCNPVAHILPYNLNRTLNGDQNSYTFTFKSNIAATSGKILFYQGGVYKGEVAITDPIVAGENSVYVAKTSLPQIDGVMTWAVQLTAAENKVIAEMTDESAGIYNFYLPQGLAIDNSPESSWFGNIYITQPVNGASDGLTTRTKNQQAGLFVYDPLLNELNTSNQGYSMGVTLPAANRHGFKRVNVDAQGNVYVNSSSAIYKASPADFTTSTTLAESKFTAINSFCMDGDIFYVMDNGTALKQLQGGTTTEIMSDASRLVSNAATDNTVLQDGHGGWWIAQGRANADIYYSLLHVNASSHAIDFSIYNNNNANLLSDCNPKSTRGAIALNSDKTILALGSNSSVIFFDIVYDGDGTPTVTRKNWTLPTLGYNIDGVAFDYADNLYVVSASVERLYMFTLPKADNTTIVPAKSTLTVDAQEHIAVTSITLSQTSASLEIGESLDLVATCLPETATDKTVEWSSDNTSVAEVNPTTGHVTAVGVGTAHIKATSTADAVESESCEITVYTLDFNVTWETNGATYTTTLLSSNADLWSQFMTGYNTYYVAKGKSARAIQPMTAVATFAWWGVIDLLTDPVSPWKWLGDYMLETADAQSVALTTETEWTTALQDFFSCTAVIVDFATAGQVAQWLPLWKDANNYLPATMRAEDAMPTIRRGAYTFMGWYDNSECTGTPVASVTADITLYALWYAPLTLDETAANADNIAANNGRTINVTFNRRFTVADGWYTLVLPFDLTAAQMAEAFGADYRLCELETSYLKSETMMYLRFRDVDDLEAGKPYLFKTGVDITDDIVFNAVTINNATPQVVTDKVTMIGLYDQTVVGASDLNYYLGYEDYLYEYLTDKTTKAFRCYFHFASPSLIQGRNARVIFRDDVTTDLEDETFEAAPAVQKIIRNGQLIIIRDGVEYNAQGQVIK